MYRAAYSQGGEIIFYLDCSGNKYAASGGSLAWRLNNPGLVHSSSRCHFGRDVIGHFDRYAIFNNPEKGHEALLHWLRTKKYFHESLKTIAKHYQPNNPDDFANRLSASTGIPVRMKVKELSEQQFRQLLFGITKLCGYILEGNENIVLLPKIIAKIERRKNEESAYLISGNIILSKKEALEWTQSHRLDAVVVHTSNGLHLRSRPHYCMLHVHQLAGKSQNIDSIARAVGSVRPSQCIWAFINGILYTKEEALEAATRISTMAEGERVLTMPNDTRNIGIDFAECILLKTSVGTPIILRAVNFVRYLIALEKEEQAPIIIFAHSQGAIILERALKVIEPSEAKRLRIFTFGGGSFIPSGNSHFDSHNYASAADAVCRLGSPILQLLALRRYYAHKAGLIDAQMMQQWASQDAILQLDSIDTKVVQKYIEERIKQYQNELERISNLTILDPDPGSQWKHEFISACYQKVVQEIVQKYRKMYAHY